MPEPTSPISSRCIGSPESRSRVDLGERRQLVGGRLERQRLEPARDQLARAARAAAPGAPSGGPLAGAPGRLVEEQLLEGEPLAGRLDVLLAAPGSGRRATASAAPASRAGPAARPAAARSRCRRQADRLPDPLPDPLRLQPFGRRVDRDQSRSVAPRPRLARRGTRARSPAGRVCHGSRSAACEPRDQLRRYPGLVEPGRTQRARLVADFDRGDREAAAPERARRIAEDLDLDRRLGAGLELGNRSDGAVAVAVGEAQKEVADGRDPGLARRVGKFRPDPPQRTQRDLEDARPGPVDRGLAELGRGQLRVAGEGPQAGPTGRRAATTSSVARRRGSRSRSRRGRGRRSRRAGSAPRRRRGR